MMNDMKWWSIKYSKYGTREAAETFDESMETVKWITSKEFFKLLPRYQWWNYDEKHLQHVYIRKNVDPNIPLWLFVQGD